jgi:pyrroloquinoline quinone biosynthesis protein B
MAPAGGSVRSPEPSPAIGPALSGILLTHAHIGHYAGLMHLGREVMGARAVPVMALPRMRAFLEGNGPWDQLVRLENIALVTLQANAAIALNARLSATPLRVPHRDEYSETCGFIVTGPRHSVAWIPDIDKWERWETSLLDLLRRVDVAYVDGTFYANGELPGRDMREIPHPFIEETLRILLRASGAERAKVRFVHFNHTNPALQSGGEAQQRIEAAGARVAVEGERVGL